MAPTPLLRVEADKGIDRERRDAILVCEVWGALLEWARVEDTPQAEWHFEGCDVVLLPVGALANRARCLLKLHVQADSLLLWACGL